MSTLALFSSPLSHLPEAISPYSSSSSSSKFHSKPYLFLLHHKTRFPVLTWKAQIDDSRQVQSSSVTVEKVPEPSPAELSSPSESIGAQNGSAPAAAAAAEMATGATFQDPRWVGGTWDLKLFQKDGNTNWDAVIDAEVQRRKLLEDNPEASSNENPVVFDTAIIPWWAWMKRFHLPEAEKLNGRAAMIGFFMAYLVDSLTGVGLVDQMGNVVCKTLLFVAVAGVLLIRKNEDVGTLKKLVEETTFYDKQWQATWKDETADSLKNE